MVESILVTPGRFIDNKTVEALLNYEKTTNDQEPIAGRAGMPGTTVTQAKLWATGNPFAILFTRQESFKTKRTDTQQVDDEYATDGQSVDGAVNGDGIAKVLVKSGEDIAYGDELEIETATGLFVERTTGVIVGWAMESPGSLSDNTLVKAKLIFLQSIIDVDT